MKFELNRGLEWMVSEGRDKEVEALLPHLQEIQKSSHYYALKLLGKTDGLQNAI